MPLDQTWLETAAATSRHLLVAVAWTAGFVLALRRRPAPDARLAATGFALLALVRLGALFFLIAFGLSRPASPFDESLWIIAIDGGPTIYLDPSHLASVADALACLLELTGAALVVAGALRAWRPPVAAPHTWPTP